MAAILRFIIGLVVTLCGVIGRQGIATFRAAFDQVVACTEANRRHAFLCKRENCSPRDLYAHHLDELKRLLAEPGDRSRLSVDGQKLMEGRDTFWKDLKFRVRLCLRPFKRFLLWCRSKIGCMSR